MIIGGSEMYKIWKVVRQQVSEDRAKSSSVQKNVLHKKCHLIKL